MAETM